MDKDKPEEGGPAVTFAMKNNRRLRKRQRIRGGLTFM